MISSGPCKLCGTTDFHIIFEGYGFDNSSENYQLVKCDGCQLVITNPIPDTASLAHYYNETYYGGSEKKFSPPFELIVKIATRLRTREFIKQLGARKNASSNRILDVGCGRADFLRELSKRGYTCYGSEILSFRFPPSKSDSDDRIIFQHGAIETIPIEKNSLDGITLWHVLEHVEDPVATINHCVELLKPDGIFAVAVPNFGSLQANFFGKHWFHLDLPRHLHHFTIQSLIRIFKKNNLRPTFLKTTSPIQNIFGVIQSASNAISPEITNYLYRIMKGGAHGGFSKFFGCRGVFSVCLGILLFPAALIEYSITALTQRGGSIIIYARKN